MSSFKCNLCLIFCIKRTVIREMWSPWNIGEGSGMFIVIVTMFRMYMWRCTMEIHCCALSSRCCHKIVLHFSVYVRWSGQFLRAKTRSELYKNTNKLRYRIRDLRKISIKLAGDLKRGEWGGTRREAVRLIMRQVPAQIPSERWFTETRSRVTRINRMINWTSN